MISTDDKKQVVSIYIRTRLYRKLKVYAARKNKAIGDVVEEFIMPHLEKNEKPKEKAV